MWEKPLENSLQPTWRCEFPWVSTLGAYFRLDTRRVTLIKFQMLFLLFCFCCFFLILVDVWHLMITIIILRTSFIRYIIVISSLYHRYIIVISSLYHGPWLYWSSVSNKPCILFENFNIPNSPSTFEPCQVSLSFPGQFIATEP